MPMGPDKWHPDRQRLASPFDDLVEAAHDPLGRWWEVDLDAQSLSVEVVQHVQKPEPATVRQAIRHEVHRPDHVRRVGHR